MKKLVTILLLFVCSQGYSALVGTVKDPVQQRINEDFDYRINNVSKITNGGIDITSNLLREFSKYYSPLSHVHQLDEILQNYTLVEKNMHIYGNLYTKDLVASENVTINGDTTVQNLTSQYVTSSSMSVTGNVIVDQIIGSSITADSMLVYGDFIGNTIFVDTMTIYGNLVGNTITADSMGVTGNITGSSITVTGRMDVAGDVEVFGDINGSAIYGSSVVLTGNVTATSINSTNLYIDSITVYGNVTANTINIDNLVATGQVNAFNLVITSANIQDILVSTITSELLNLVDLKGTGSLLFTGTAGGIPVEGAGERFMWHPAKRALRVGYVTGTQWDNSNIGPWSVATGGDTIASGICSNAMNYDTRSLGFASLSTGEGTIAQGDQTLSSGYYVKIYGQYSSGFGKFITSHGTNTITMGSGIDGILKPLLNNIDNSFMVGFNASTPTFAIYGANSRVVVDGNVEVGGNMKITETDTTAQYIATFSTATDGTYAVAISTAGNLEVTGDIIFTRVFVATGTRAFNGASGDVSYTTCPFTPKKLTIYANIEAQASYSIGITDGSTMAIQNKWGTYFQQTLAKIVMVYDSVGINGQIAILKSFNSNGVTLTWTLDGGSTAGTVDLIFVYER